MILQKDKILKLIQTNNLITSINPTHIGEFTVDLMAERFYSGDDNFNCIKLLPMRAVICQTYEIIDLPNDIVGFVSIRNKWLRNGLVLHAPIFHPGHKTQVTFALQNISTDEIRLVEGESYAQIMFYELSHDAKPYIGKYYNEMYRLVDGAFNKV